MKEKHSTGYFAPPFGERQGMTPEKQVFVEMDAKELAAFKLGLEVAAKVAESYDGPCGADAALIADAIRARSE